MGIPHPVSLPPGFNWELIDSGLQLRAGSTSVLEVRRQRMGWVVRINVPGRSQYARTLVVGSEVAGVRFGNKWARSHKELLDLARSPGGDDRASTAGTQALPDIGRSSAALPAYLELIGKLDEIHELREQLDAAMDRIEASLGEMMRHAHQSERERGQDLASVEVPSDADADADADPDADADNPRGQHSLPA